MSNKNTTHIRGLYDVKDWYNAGKYQYHYYINSDTYHKDEIRYRTRDIQRFYNLRKKYDPKNKKLFYQSSNSNKRKNSPKTKKYHRYQIGVQTSDSLLFDDSDCEKMVCVFNNDHFNNDLFLFPYLKRRILMKYFRLWVNRFYRVRAFKFQQIQFVDSNIDDGYEPSNDIIEPENVLNFDFECDDDIIENNNNKEKSIYLQYGPDDHGIKDVTFKVM